MRQVFRVDGTVSMPCVATASVPIAYRWHYNGAVLDVNAGNMRPLRDGTGSFVIEPANVRNEASYQCFAVTQYGTAVSNTSVLQAARLQAYPRRVTVRMRVGQIGKPLRIPVAPLRSFPPPSFSWEIGPVVGIGHGSPTYVVRTGRRIQISETGDLHFAYVIRGDASVGGRVYKNVATNPYLDASITSGYTRVGVVHVPLRRIRPTIAFTSPTQVVALEGQQASLRCFFYGYPSPRVHFRKLSGTLPIGRYRIERAGTELVIDNVQSSDEGDYKCVGSNPVGRHEQVIRINVHAIPVFRQIADGPQNVNVTAGDSVTFYCSAYAKPEARVDWFENGQRLDPRNLPTRFRLRNENRQLEILNVHGQRVIQCNASNYHGYAFRNGYVNAIPNQMERRTGNNPEEEWLDNGFRDHETPSEIKGGRATLEIMGKPNSDDGGSLNKYSRDVDFSKFNEEGSFVGE